MTSDVTIAFMNIGIMEQAFAGKCARVHLKKIKTQVSQLFQHHDVQIFCFVEVGQPRKGLSSESKVQFESAVQAGAADAERVVRFLRAEENEAMVMAYVPEMNVTSGSLIKELYHRQPWRNAMPFYLQGPTEQDRIQILLSHQPSSGLHTLSMNCRQEVLRELIAHGLNLQNWPYGAAEHSTTNSVPRCIIGGDLNTTPTVLTLLAPNFTDEPIETATSKADLSECKHGDIAIGSNMNFIHTDCMVQNRDPSRDIVLTVFP